METKKLLKCYNNWLLKKEIVAIHDRLEQTSNADRNYFPELSDNNYEVHEKWHRWVWGWSLPSVAVWSRWQVMADKKTKKKKEEEEKKEEKKMTFVLEDYEYGAKGEQRILDWKDLK